MLQEHELMAQLAQQLAAVQAERDRLAEQVAVLRATPDAPLAAGARRPSRSTQTVQRC